MWHTLFFLQPVYMDLAFSLFKRSNLLSSMPDIPYIFMFEIYTPTWHFSWQQFSIIFGHSHVLVLGRMWNFIIPARMRARDAQLWCHRILFISIYVSSLQKKEINKTKWGHNTFGFSIFLEFPFFLFAFRLSVFQLRFFMNFNERSASSSVVSLAIFCLVCYAKCILQQTSRKSSMELSLSLHLRFPYFPPQLGIF